MPPYPCALLLAHAGSSCGARIGKPDKIGPRVDANLEQSVKHLFFHSDQAERRNLPKSVRLSIEILPFVTWQTFSKFKCGTVRQAVGSQATVAGPWLLLLTHRGSAAYSSRWGLVSAGSAECVKGKAILAASRPCTHSAFFRPKVSTGDGRERLRRRLRT